jgi:hypothetical protein
MRDENSGSCVRSNNTPAIDSRHLSLGRLSELRDTVIQQSQKC